jgi:hypothetical protein
MQYIRTTSLLLLLFLSGCLQDFGRSLFYTYGDDSAFIPKKAPPKSQNIEAFDWDYFGFDTTLTYEQNQLKIWPICRRRFGRGFIESVFNRTPAPVQTNGHTMLDNCLEAGEAALHEHYTALPQ